MGGHQAHVARHGFDDHRRDSSAITREQLAECGIVVVSKGRGIFHDRRRNAGRVGIAEGGSAATCFHEQGVRMAVVGAVELHDHVPPREAARHAQSAHRGLGPTRHATQHLYARITLDHRFREAHLSLRRRAERKALGSRFRNALHDLGMRVTEDRRTPRTDVVEIRIVVGIEDARPERTRDEQRMPANRAERAYRAIHPAGHQALRALHQPVRCRMPVRSTGRHTPVLTFLGQMHSPHSAVSQGDPPDRPPTSCQAAFARSLRIGGC